MAPAMANARWNWLTALRALFVAISSRALTTFYGTAGSISGMVILLFVFSIVFPLLFGVWFIRIRKDRIPR